MMNPTRSLIAKFDEIADGRAHHGFHRARVFGQAHPGVENALAQLDVWADEARIVALPVRNFACAIRIESPVADRSRM